MDESDFEVGEQETEGGGEKEIKKEQNNRLEKGLLAEWKGFRLKEFFTGLFFSVLPAFYDTVTENLLGWEYIHGSEQSFITDDVSTIPRDCQIVMSSSNFTTLLNQHRFHENLTTLKGYTYTCGTEPNPFLGIITIAIPFLPGIQWYAFLKTTKQQAFTKFITSLFFPFFLLFFKVGHLFIPGSSTKELMLLVDSCETISESTIQLVFQVTIMVPSILNPSGGTPITTLQILVLVKAFIMASKGAAEEFLAAKMKRMKEDGLKIEGTGRATETDHEPVNNQGQTFTQCFCLKTEVAYYHQMGIGKKLLLIAGELPFYTSLTTFRVLSMSCVITSFGFASIPVYGVLILIIVIIGYMMTSKENDFLVRGLKSAITTVDECYHAEKYFQTYWLVVNILLLAVIETPVLVEEGLLLNSRTLLVCLILCTGLLSYVLFHCQRCSDMTPKRQEIEESKTDRSLWGKALNDCKNWRKTQNWQWGRTTVSVSSFVSSLLDPGAYIWVAIGFYSREYRIMAVGAISIIFLTGIQWHTMGFLKGSHRLSWFLSSLFFPLTITFSRFLAIFVHGDNLRELNLWMNGPRNHWGRGLFLSMDLVALFNLDPDLTAFFLLSIFFYTRSSWMEAEQVLMARQRRANQDGRSKHRYVNNTLWQTLKHQGKFFPFALVSLVFRVTTFSLTISLLKFYAIPLYAVLVLLAIGLGVFWNKDTDSFVIKGFQSVLFMANEAYGSDDVEENPSGDGPEKKNMIQGDAPFQVFWFVVNMLLTTCLTLCVKLGPDFSIPGLDFSPYNYLELEKLRIIQDTLMFDVVIATIYATGCVSICLFFLMKKFKVASALPSDQEDSKKGDIESEGEQIGLDTL